MTILYAVLSIAQLYEPREKIYIVLEMSERTKP